MNDKNAAELGVLAGGLGGGLAWCFKWVYSVGLWFSECALKVLIVSKSFSFLKTKKSKERSFCPFSIRNILPLFFLGVGTCRLVLRRTAQH